MKFISCKDIENENEVWPI